jgi:hypothetical protein
MALLLSAEELSLGLFFPEPGSVVTISIFIYS